MARSLAWFQFCSKWRTDWVFALFTRHLYACALLPQCSRGYIGPLALQKEALFSISVCFCLLSSKQALHIPQLPLKATHVHLHKHTHAKLTTDCLWSLESLLEMRASNFYSTCSHMQTCAHSFYFTQYILSEQICIFILMLLVYLSNCEVWPTCSVHFVTIKGNPHPAISPADGYRYCNCFKIM